MLLFGPSTEDATYVILAPALVLSMVDAFYQPWLAPMRVLPCVSFAVLLLGLGMNSFLSLKKSVYTMSVQPFGALIFIVYALTWTLTSSLWNQHGSRTEPRGQEVN